MAKFPTPHRVVLEVLKEVREEVGLKRDRLSRRLGRSANYIQRKEADTRGMSITSFMHICEGMGVLPSTVMKRIERRLKTLQAPQRPRV
jgi:transcriptional regulator with XRE-family HTH domain